MQSDALMVVAVGYGGPALSRSEVGELAKRHGLGGGLCPSDDLVLTPDLGQRDLCC
jgi:hypothetical protein